MTRPLPLDGVTVLSIEQYGAGPFGTTVLADMGAEVVKIENPAEGGDVARSVGPYWFGEGDSHFYQSFGRNKRSLTLNLKHPEGQRLLREMARHADAVFNNLRGDLPAKLGLDYASLSAVNPAIVCAHLSAYGREGSRAAWPGYDYLMQAEAGYCMLTGEPDGPPARAGLSLVDMMTGVLASFALVSGLIGARNTGKGMDVDVSLFDTALHNLGYLAVWALNGGHAQGREPRGAHPSLGPTQIYPTADGWLFTMCNKEKFFPLIAARMGHPEWAEDPRFSSFRGRLENRAALTEIMDAVFRTRPTAHWLEAFAGVVPAAPVLDVEQALHTDFVAERGAVQDFARREGGPTVRMLAGPVRVNGELPPTIASPRLGEATEEMLGRIGVDPASVAALRAKGVV